MSGARSGLVREAWRFAGVGAVGFLVDAAVLSWLVQARGWGLFEARAVSFGLAVSVTWYLNRRLTFAHRASAGRAAEYGRYFGVQGIGALINLGVYAIAVTLAPALGALPVIPLAMGSAVAMVFNFLAARHLAFVGVEDRSEP